MALVPRGGRPSTLHVQILPSATGAVFKNDETRRRTLHALAAPFIRHERI